MMKCREIEKAKKKGQQSCQISPVEGNAFFFISIQVVQTVESAHVLFAACLSKCS